MRTNIVIDDELISRAMTAIGARTKKEAVERGLQLLLQVSGQAELRELRGAFHWEGDLDAMRTDR
jgi:Arc/MetJ family transcription regulator